MVWFLGKCTETPLCCSTYFAVFPIVASLHSSISIDQEGAGPQNNANRNTSDLLDQLLSGYDNRLRPGFGGHPTIVDVNINVRSMGPISEQEMAYQIDCYFRQGWVDKRLRFSGPLKVLPVSVNILERIWKPDTHIFNGQKSYIHMMTTPNKLLRIRQDGRVLYSMRVTIKASCTMRLENFPLDTQVCPLQIGSYGYSAHEVKYEWTRGASDSIKMAPDMRLSQFDLIGFPASNETDYGNARKSGWTIRSGGFSSLVVFFKMRRHMGYFMINVYVPCTLLTIISWVGFWINREATADRVGLGITTVLTMCLLGIDNRNDLPKVSYATALDYFVAVCFVFVLATVMQFAFVHFFTKHGSGEVQRDAESTSGSDTEDDDNDDDEKIIIPVENSWTSVEPAKSHGNRVDQRASTRVYDHHCCLKLWNCILGNAIYRQVQSKGKHHTINSVSQIDRWSRYLFPLSFIFFNIFYWSLYASQTM